MKYFLTLVFILAVSCGKDNNKKSDSPNGDANPTTQPEPTKPDPTQPTRRKVEEGCVNKNLEININKNSTVIEIAKAFSEVGRKCNADLKQVEKYFGVSS